MRTNKRWVVAVFLFLGTAINYLDRSVLGMAGPPIMQELAISKVEFGVLASAFFWSYCLMQIPSGLIVDKLGTKIAYAGAVIWWSIATVITGVSRSFGFMVGSRILMGIGEAPAFPVNTRIMAEWFPASERGKANALVNAGMKVGSGLMGGIVAWIIVAYGWRVAFIVCGALGLVLSLFWIMVFKKNPADDKAVNAQELEYISAGQSKGSEDKVASNFRWYDAIRYKEVWILGFGVFVANYQLYLIMTWFPTYLVSRGMTLLNAGLASMVPFMAAVGGALIGGTLSDYLINKKGYTPLKARKISLISGLFGIFVCILPAPYASSNVVALILISGGLFSGGLFGSNCWAIVADIAPKSSVGGIAGFQNFIGQFPGILAPIATGYIVQTTNSYVLAFNIPGVLAIIAVLLYVYGLKGFQIRSTN